MALIQKQIRENFEQPRLEMRAQREAVEILPRSQIGFLNQIVGAARLAHEMQRHRVDAIQQRHSQFFELLPADRVVLRRTRASRSHAEKRFPFWNSGNRPSPALIHFILLASNRSVHEKHLNTKPQRTQSSQSILFQHMLESNLQSS